MLQLGAERVILNSLMKHPGWGQVQANGCIALRNLGRDEAYPGQLLHDGRVVPSCMADFWGTLRHSFSWCVPESNINPCLALLDISMWCSVGMAGASGSAQQRWLSG